MNRRRSLWVSFVVALVCGQAIPVTADPFSPVFAGQWVGRGTLVNGFEGPERKGRCNVELLKSICPGELRMEGFCAIAADRSSLVLRVVRIEGSRLQAGFRTQGLDETAQYGGKYHDNSIDLKSKTPFHQDGVQFHSRISVNIDDDDHFTLDDWVWRESGGGERHVVSLTFERLGHKG